MGLIILCILTCYLLYLLVNLDQKSGRARDYMVNSKKMKKGKIIILESWIQRRVGLLNSLNLAPLDGLLFKKCKGLHTLGMCYEIDIVFINKKNEIIEIHRNTPPGIPKISAPKGTSDGIEFSRGSIAQMNLKLGDLLEVLS